MDSGQPGRVCHTDPDRSALKPGDFDIIRALEGPGGWGKANNSGGGGRAHR
jgi:hypothetical protein